MSGIDETIFWLIYLVLGLVMALVSMIVRNMFIAVASALIIILTYIFMRCEYVL